VVGALEAYVMPDEKLIYADNLSVRSGWKRNTIGSKLMQALKDEWPGFRVTHSEATPQGKQFLTKTGQWNPDKPQLQAPKIEVREINPSEPMEKKTVESLIRRLVLLEAEDITPQMLAWARGLVASLRDGGVWGVPATGQAYQLNHGNKTMTLIHGPVHDSMGWHKKSKEVFRRIGWRVLDGPENPDEMTVTEAIVDYVLGGLCG
jgi:hypothetical protein